MRLILFAALLGASLALAACDDDGDAPAVVDTATETEGTAAASPSPSAADEATATNAIETGVPETSTAEAAEPEATTGPGPGTLALTLVPAFAGLTFERPVDLDPLPGQEGAYLVVEQHGVVRLVGEGSGDVPVAVDLTDRVGTTGNEEGLLGLALAPDFAESGHVYMYYTQGSPAPARLSRFQYADGAIDGASEQVLLEVEQPYANHNGGALAFGPDGYLYLGLGDGGAGGDPHGHGQNTFSLLGKVLRVDVSGGGAYSIPPDNPFAGGEDGAPEVYAYGLRNPWRFSFDRASGELWLADVGQGAQEEVDVVAAGGNYGWNQTEGDACYTQGCDPSLYLPPVAVYGHDEGCSVTGGYVYRGSELADLQGWYVYADFCSGRTWALPADLSGQPQVIFDDGPNVASFAETADGELLLLAFDGIIYRLASA
jgi:glucose/arabinose dehydrogenase